MEEGEFRDEEFSRSPPFTLLFPLGCDVPSHVLTRFKRPERGKWTVIRTSLRRWKMILLWRIDPLFFLKGLLLKSESVAVRSGRNSSPGVTLSGLGDELGRVDSRPPDCRTSREGRAVQRKDCFTFTTLHGATVKSRILGCLANKVKVFGFGQVFIL